MNIILSIIIPTYKRKKSVLRLLSSIKREIKPNYEVIIVEQYLSHKEALISFAEQNNINFQYIFLEKPSTPQAKNIGVRNAHGKYIIFFDDDVVVHSGIFDAYLHTFKNEKIDIIAGRVLTPGQPVTADSNKVGRISYWGHFSDNFSSTIKQKVDTMIGCNAGWSKKSFEEVGGFDEQITMNGIREESDLAIRARKKGYVVIFEPKALVTHMREETGGGRKSEGRLWWYYNFFSNETYFFLKYRPFWVVCIILFTRWEWILRCMLGFGREISIRSIITPFAGIAYGYRKYRRWKNANSC